MKISETGGELAIIDMIKKQAKKDENLLLGIGDDAALIAPSDKLAAITTDLLVEGVHFRTDLTSFYDLGYKSIAVNLSDIAAMGALPRYSFISVALPDMDIENVEEIFRGMLDVSKKYGSVIAGGDTTRSLDKIVINVAQTGCVDAEYAASRHSAKPGDAVIITNTPGNSRAGLELLLKFGYTEAEQISRDCVRAQVHPEPRINAARSAVLTRKVNAMMDLSDGLASDLTKLCAASEVGAEIYANKLPISDALRKAAKALDVKDTALAVGGGEDYELLITSAEPDIVCAAIEKTGTAASVIGYIKEGCAPELLTDNKKTNLTGSWEHF